MPQKTRCRRFPFALAWEFEVVTRSNGFGVNGARAAPRPRGTIANPSTLSLGQVDAAALHGNSMIIRMIPRASATGVSLARPWELEVVSVTRLFRITSYQVTRALQPRKFEVLHKLEDFGKLSW